MIFGPNLPKKGYFWSETENVNISIEFYINSLGTKFQLKLTILIFWNKFIQKGYFRSKTEKIVFPRASMVVAYYIKLFRTGPGILMSLLLPSHRGNWHDVIIFLMEMFTITENQLFCT